MDNEILDTNLDNKRKEYRCVKKTLNEKLKDIFFVLIIWIPTFILLENFFLSDGGSLYRVIFYSGSALGYVLYILFNRIYKKI